MKISMAVLADEANVSTEGKLNVMGVFDRIAASDFPVIHPRMVFAFRVEADSADSGRVIPMRVTMEDEDGTVHFEAVGEMGSPPVPPGEFSTANQVFGLVRVMFPRPGLYRFVIRLADEVYHETPVLVQHAARDPSLN